MILYLKVLLQDPVLFTLIQKHIAIEYLHRVTSARAVMELKCLIKQPISAL